LSGRWGDDFSHFTASDGHVLIVEQIVIVSTAVVTTIGLRTLRRLNSELEARVQQRTRELSERVQEVESLARALKEANGNLLAANEDLESFSYSVSHDLRAPLRNVTGFLELLSRHTPTEREPERVRIMTIVQNETKRMGRLIDDLLAFARLGRSDLQLQQVNLEELVATVREELKSEIGERSVQWQVGPLPHVRGDPALLRLVFANLLGNAVKFTRGRAEARIEIGATLPTHGDTMPTVFVRDNGAGFDPKYRDKLFGVFQRLHHSRDFEGTGIGLANVKRIVSRHGGRVWAEGRVDQGATFHFTIMPTVPDSKI
jgi:light-regulated signal transduction histidine kinase (bacteriophytochrome)